MVFFLLLGAALILSGFYFLFLTYLAKNPANLSTAVGMLTRASGYKNVPTKQGWKIKDQTEYTYSYTVNEKTYRRKGIMNRHKRYLPQRVTIVYLTGFPRHSGIESFTAQLELALGIFLLCEGAAMIVLCLLIRSVTFV